MTILIISPLLYIKIVNNQGFICNLFLFSFVFFNSDNRYNDVMIIKPYLFHKIYKKQSYLGLINKRSGLQPVSGCVATRSHERPSVY